MKVGNIDPRGERGYVDTISDKVRAIGGGVLEAILHLYPNLNNSRLTGAAKTNCKG